MQYFLHESAKNNAMIFVKMPTCSRENDCENHPKTHHSTKLKNLKISFGAKDCRCDDKSMRESVVLRLGEKRAS